MDFETIRRTPKVLLHDHLDGGLRPATIVALAEDHGYRGLPTTDAGELAEALHQGRGGVDLEGYLRAFAHTVGVTQTREALMRVARECAEDHAADGVVHAEVRFAPELHTERGLDLDEVVEAVLQGFAEGSEGTDLTIRAILTTLRTARHSERVAEAAVRWRDDGVVGFDIAGAEAGHPPTEHLEAFHYIQRENFHITIHAGEAYGLASIWEAIQYCGAERLGHGVRLVDDTTEGPDGPTLGRLAAFVRDRRIALELCPTSNVHTGAVPSVEEHPFDLFFRLGLRVTVNTDNRLMSGITLSDELAALSEAFGYGLDELETFAINAAKASFSPFDERTALIEEVLVPRFDALRAEEA